MMAMRESKRRTDELMEVWPPLLTIVRAIAYSGCSRSTLGRAIRRGDLPLHGRAGGRGQRIVRREDLDRWMAGELQTSRSRIEKAPRRPRPTYSAPVRSTDVAAALERIRLASQGKK
jgi:hypothetical protein